MSAYEDGGEGTLLTTRLTQDETLMYRDGQEAEIQVRWITADENARATGTVSVDIGKILLNEVIVYV